MSGEPRKDRPAILRTVGREADGDRPPRVHDQLYKGQPQQPDPVETLLHLFDPVHREEQKPAPAPADKNTGQQMDLPLPDPADGVGRGALPRQPEKVAIVQVPRGDTGLHGRPQRGKGQHSRNARQQQGQRIPPLRPAVPQDQQTHGKARGAPGQPSQLSPEKIPPDRFHPSYKLSGVYAPKPSPSTSWASQTMMKALGSMAVTVALTTAN